MGDSAVWQCRPLTLYMLANATQKISKHQSMLRQLCDTARQQASYRHDCRERLDLTAETQLCQAAAAAAAAEL
jgi:hypothetical protein